MKYLYRYRFGDTLYDESRAELKVGEQTVHLQLRQRKLLSFFLTNPRTVLGRDELLDRVWGYNSDTKDHALTAAVDRLRRALGRDGGCLKTVHGKGYQLDALPTREVVGSEYASTLDLQADAEVRQRPGFRLSALLGRSSNCEVWLTTNAATGERRACKFTADAEGLRAIRREARLLAHAARALGPHASLVQLLASHFEAPPFFIEMSYGGEDLLRWIGRMRWFESATRVERVALFLQVADAAAALHAVPLVHADLKPRNILVEETSPGQRAVRIIDFGSGYIVANRVRDQVGALQESLAVADLGADPTRGTFMYFAPELWSGIQPNVRSDIFSLGVLLYQLVVGDLSVRPESGWQRHVDDPLLAADIRRAIDGDPGERFGSVGEFARSLRLLQQRHADLLRAQEAARDAERAAQENTLLRQRAARARARRPALACAFGFLVAGLLTISVLLVQARERGLELATQKRATELLNHFLDQDLLAGADPAIVGHAGLSVADAVTRAIPLIDAKYASEPAAARALLHVDMQRTLLALSRYAESEQEGQHALLALQSQASTPAAELMEIHLDLAAADDELSRLADARRELELADRYRTQGHLEQTTLGMMYWRERALVESYAYQLPKALQYIDEARRAAAASSGVAIAARDKVELTYADINKMAGHFDVSEATLRALQAGQAGRYGADHPLTCFTSMALAMVMGYAGKTGAALPIARDAQQCLERRLGRLDMRTGIALDVLAGLHFQAEDWDRAATTWREELARTEPELGASNGRLINVRGNIARCYRHAGQFRLAEDVLRDAMRAARTRTKDDAPLLQSLRFELADVLLSQGKAAEVEGLLAGLSPAALASVSIAPDWQARLDYAHGRLDLLNKDFAQAVAHLASTQLRLSRAGGDDRLPASTVQALMERARRGASSGPE